MRNWLAAAALFMASTVSGAATYAYIAQPYNFFADFTNPCAIPSCANFAPGMRFQGSFSTAANLAPNLVNAEITPLLTGYSFSDGLTTYSSADAQSRVVQMRVDTDAGGNITVFSVALQRWQGAAAPHVVGDRHDLVSVAAGSGPSPFHNLQCAAVGVSGSNGVADVCTAQAFDASSSQTGQNLEALPVLVAAAATPVPTLTQWALVALALALAALGFRGHRSAQGRRPGGT